MPIVAIVMTFVHIVANVMILVHIGTIVMTNVHIGTNWHNVMTFEPMCRSSLQTPMCMSY